MPQKSNNSSKAKSNSTAKKTTTKSNTATKTNSTAAKKTTTAKNTSETVQNESTFKDVAATTTKKFKSETKSTVNDVKESMKNVNIKEDTKVTSNFVSSFLKNPIDTLRVIANDRKNNQLKTALVLLIIWTAVLFIESIFGYHWTFKAIGTRLLTIVRTIVVPIASLCVLSTIIYLMQKPGKKSLTTIFTTITIAATPKILVDILSILTLFASDFSKIVSPISYFATAISIVYVYFSTKYLLDIEEDSKVLNKFAISQCFYFILYFLLTFLGVYLPIL